MLLSDIDDEFVFEVILAVSDVDVIFFGPGDEVIFVESVVAGIVLVEDEIESVFDGILVESDVGGGILLVGENAESVFGGIRVESNVDGILAESVVGGILLIDDDIESVVDGVLLVEEDIESVADDTISVAGLGLSVALYVDLHEASAAIAITVIKITGFINEIFLSLIIIVVMAI